MQLNAPQLRLSSPRKPLEAGSGGVLVALQRVGAGWAAHTAGALAGSQRHQGMFWEALEKAAQG